MSWTPSTRDLETVATMSHAKAPAAQIARAVGISTAEFEAWCARLAQAREFMMALAVLPLPPRRQVEVAEPGRCRIVADRVFGGEGSG